MNNVTLVGRLARDPEMKMSAGSQTAITRFTVAVDRQFKQDGQPSADFIGCVAFGKTGEFVDHYFNKGKMIGVQGRIQTGSYKKQDGTTVYTTDVVADRVEFVGGKNDSGNGGGDYSSAPKQEFTAPEGFQTLEDEDIPF